METDAPAPQSEASSQTGSETTPTDSQTTPTTEEADQSSSSTSVKKPVEDDEEEHATSIRQSSSAEEKGEGEGEGEEGAGARPLQRLIHIRLDRRSTLADLKKKLEEEVQQPSSEFKVRVQRSKVTRLKLPANLITSDVYMCDAFVLFSSGLRRWKRTMIMAFGLACDACTCTCSLACVIASLRLL